MNRWANIIRRLRRLLHQSPTRPCRKISAFPSCPLRHSGGYATEPAIRRSSSHPAVCSGQILWCRSKKVPYRGKKVRCRSQILLYRSKKKRCRSQILPYRTQILRCRSQIVTCNRDLCRGNGLFGRTFCKNLNIFGKQAAGRRQCQCILLPSLWEGLGGGA